MLERTQVAALFVLAPLAVCLSGACLADAPDGEAPAMVAEPMVPGPCQTACLMVRIGVCNWEDQCDLGGEQEALCGSKWLSRDACEHAANGEAWGLEDCYRECEGLH